MDYNLEENDPLFAGIATVIERMGEYEKWEEKDYDITLSYYNMTFNTRTGIITEVSPPVSKCYYIDFSKFEYFNFLMDNYDRNDVGDKILHLLKSFHTILHEYLCMLETEVDRKLLEETHIMMYQYMHKGFKVYVPLSFQKNNFIG